MHSSDRTLLASFGFADPDKGDLMHDRACQYLATLEVHRQIGEMFELMEGNDLVLGWSRLEVPLAKGAGQYKTVVGFVDVILTFDQLYPCRGPSCCSEPPSEPHRKTCGMVAIEVKIRPLPVGNILRQISLYREYLPPAYWVLVTDFDLSVADHTTLINANITPVRLGPGFDAWLAEQERLRTEPAATNRVSLII